MAAAAVAAVGGAQAFVATPAARGLPTHSQALLSMLPSVREIAASEAFRTCFDLRQAWCVDIIFEEQAPWYNLRLVNSSEPCAFSGSNKVTSR